MSDLTPAPAVVQSVGLSFDVKGFKKALDLVCKAIPRLVLRPVLRMVRLTVGPDGAFLEATDLDKAIKVRIGGVYSTSEYGSVMIDPAQVKGFLKNVGVDRAYLNQHPDKVVIRTDYARSEMPIDPNQTPDLFPTAPAWDAKSGCYKVAPAEMVANYDRVAYATDEDSTRYALGSILLELADDGTGVAVATDGRRLARRTFDCDKVARPKGRQLESTMLVPVPSFKLVRDAAKWQGETVEFQSAPDGAMIFRSGDVEIYSRRQEGRFPRYQDVFPQSQDVAITLDADELVEVMSQAVATNVEATRKPSTDGQYAIDLLIADSAVVVEAHRNGSIAYTRRMQAETSGPVRYAYLDSRYVLDIVKSLGKRSGEMTVKLVDDSSPVVFTAESGRLSCIIMPMHGREKGESKKCPVSKRGIAMLARLNGPTPAPVVVEVTPEPTPVVVEAVEVESPAPAPVVERTIIRQAACTTEPTEPEVKPLNPVHSTELPRSVKATDFAIGDRVILARSIYPDRIGMSGTVIKVIKSRKAVRFLKDGADPKHSTSTYDASPENIDKLPPVSPLSDPDPLPPLSGGSPEATEARVGQYHDIYGPIDPFATCLDIPTVEDDHEADEWILEDAYGAIIVAPSRRSRLAHVEDAIRVIVLHILETEVRIASAARVAWTHRMSQDRREDFAEWLEATGVRIDPFGDAPTDPAECFEFLLVECRDGCLIETSETPSGDDDEPSKGYNAGGQGTVNPSPTLNTTGFREPRHVVREQYPVGRIPSSVGLPCLQGGGRRINVEPMEETDAFLREGERLDDRRDLDANLRPSHPQGTCGGLCDGPDDHDGRRQPEKIPVAYPRLDRIQGGLPARDGGPAPERNSLGQPAGKLGLGDTPGELRGQEKARNEPEGREIASRETQRDASLRDVEPAQIGDDEQRSKRSIQYSHRQREADLSGQDLETPSPVNSEWMVVESRDGCLVSFPEPSTDPDRSDDHDREDCDLAGLRGGLLGVRSGESRPEDRGDHGADPLRGRDGGTPAALPLVRGNAGARPRAFTTLDPSRPGTVRLVIDPTTFPGVYRHDSDTEASSVIVPVPAGLRAGDAGQDHRPEVACDDANGNGRLSHAGVPRGRGPAPRVEAPAPAAGDVEAPDTLTIGGEPYEVARTADGYEVMKWTGDCYRITLSASEAPSCECGDFRHRRAGLDSLGCKHIRGLRAAGLLPVPTLSGPAPEFSPSTEIDPMPSLADYGLMPVSGGSEEADPKVVEETDEVFEKRAKCRHFNGIGQGTCKAGVTYKSVWLDHDPIPFRVRKDGVVEPRVLTSTKSMPCLGPRSNVGEVACPKFEATTEEDIAARQAQIDRAMDCHRRGVSTCCEAPHDESQVIKSGKYKGHGRRYCSKCGRVTIIV